MSTQWKGRREIGSPWLMKAFARTCLAVGPRVARLMLGPVCAYFFLVKGEARRASRAFLGLALERPVTAGDVWRHFWTFSQVVLDRVFILGREGRGITLEKINPGALLDALDQGRGCLMLGSHLGSFEASRAIKRARPEVDLRLVMDRQHSPAATAFLEALNPDVAKQVLDIGARPGAGLSLLTALQNGALVALLADRPRGGEKTVTVTFMGKPARFPAAPFEVAMVTQAPVVLFWGLHAGNGHYRNVFESLAPPPRVPRAERDRVVRECAQRYAERLEHHARAAPYNWFNFYDFWADDDA